MLDFLSFINNDLVLFCILMFGASLFPGPSFLLTLQNGLKYSRKIGFVSSIGLGFGLIPNIIASIFGIAALIHTSDWMFDFIRYAGAIFLLLLGIQSLFFKKSENIKLAHKRAADPSLKRAFTEGFFVNALNPKGILFFVAVFSQFFAADMALVQKAAYGLAAFTIEIGWFCILIIILHHPQTDKFTSFFMKWVDEFCGILFFVLAIKLVFF